MASIVTTQRLVLRTWRDTDTQPFIKMGLDEEVMQYFPKLLTPGETTEMIGRINHGFIKNGFGLMAVEEKSSGRFIGFTWFSIPKFEAFFTPCVEIGWRFKKDAWGQGFATEAANACLTHGFNVLGFEKIVSFTAAVNKRSENVMKRIGMVYSGEFNHPKIHPASALYPHVMYTIQNPKG